MPKYKNYQTDYLKRYPELAERPDIVQILQRSDRKMKYAEVCRKRERFHYDPNKHLAVFHPSREDSLERMQEEQHQQFPDETNLEELILLRQDIRELRLALRQLDQAERYLLYLRYWQELSQAEISEKLAVSQQTVSYRERKILSKLKKFLKK